MFGRFTNFSNVFSRFGDLVLAFLVVCIIGLLIIPLPTPMVDLLISINLMISPASALRRMRRVVVTFRASRYSVVKSSIDGNVENARARGR